MRSAIEMVRAFHEKFNAPIGDIDRPDISSRTRLRLALIHEELKELESAIDSSDLIEVTDALADLAYVVIGAAVEWGIDLAPVFAEVHRSNMTKTPGNQREDGKILKGAAFEPPRIAEIVRSRQPVPVAVRTIYVAHPFGGDIANAERARLWLRWLLDHEAGVRFSASWLAYSDVLSGSDPAHKERAIRDCLVAAADCDGIVLVGGHVSTGMRQERDACLRGGGIVYDLTPLGAHPLGISTTTQIEIQQVGPLAWALRQLERS